MSRIPSARRDNRQFRKNRSIRFKLAPGTVDEQEEGIVPATAARRLPDGTGATMRGTDRLKGWERCGLGALGLAIVLFGVLTVYRSAGLSRRMGDAGIFFRAGWAARAGGEK